MKYFYLMVLFSVASVTVAGNLHHINVPIIFFGMTISAILFALMIQDWNEPYPGE